jgi:tetratricopeptide (TPR) repeat protein
MMAVSANRLGRYELRREIARSNDVVYEAWDPSVNRRVAVKEMVMPPGMTGTAAAERIQRFYREARAAGGLSHPNIVTIYEVGEDSGRHFISMEFLEGPTLRESLQGGQTIPVDQAALIGAQIADALDYAHKHGVVHRDIKPDNVHLIAATMPKLTDFGIARIEAETNITLSGQVFGTPSYMSPEQVAGGEIDARTDIFSLGVMLFEMVSGHKPFVGESVVTITYNIVHESPVMPPNVPEWMAAILRKALSKRPEDRYATAEQMAADLRMHRPPAGASANAWGAQAPSGFAPPPGAGIPPYVFQAPRRRMTIPWPKLSDESKTFLVALTVTAFVGALLYWGIWVGGQAFHKQREAQTNAIVSTQRRKAAAAYDRDDYATAIRGFQWVFAQTNNPLDRQNLVNAHIEYGIQQGGTTALAHFQEAARIAPDNAMPRVYEAQYYQMIGQPYLAVEQADAALGILNGGASDLTTAVRPALAQIYIALGDQARISGPIAGQGAEDLWRKAAQADPAGPYGAAAEMKLRAGSP